MDILDWIRKSSSSYIVDSYSQLDTDAIYKICYQYYNSTYYEYFDGEYSYFSSENNTLPINKTVYVLETNSNILEIFISNTWSPIILNIYKANSYNRYDTWRYKNITQLHNKLIQLRVSDTNLDRIESQLLIDFLACQV